MSALRPRLGRVATLAWLAFPGLFYLLITAFWLHRDMSPLVGDEPTYLLLGDVLTTERALNLEPAYRSPTAIASPMNTVRKGDAVYSHHGLGLPLLVGMPYRLRGVVGAKAALCCLAGLLVTVFYCVLRVQTGSRGWAVAGFLAVATSLPFTMAAGQIYPDLLAGLILVYLFYLITRGFRDRRQWPSLLGFALACGFLPWLHHRHLPVAVLFDLAFAWRLLFATSEAGGPSAAPWRDRLRLGSRRLLVPLAVMLLLQALELVYTIWLFGSPFGVNVTRAFNLYTAMMFLGLHLDQFNGLFFQDPLFLLGLAGLALFVRARPRSAALWAAVYLLSILPICVNSIGYGGAAFPGRYQWDFAGMWIFPFAYLMDWMLRRRGGEVALAVVLTASACLQLFYAHQWIPGTVKLISEASKPVWAISTFYGTLRWQLPWFGSPWEAFLYWPNLAWTMVAASVVVVGLLLAKDETRTSAWAVLLPAALLVTIPQQPVLSTMTFPTVMLPKATGRDVGIRRIANEGEDAAGALSTGPVVDLPSGCYDVALRYQSSIVSDEDASSWDWTGAGGGIVLAQGRLPPAPTGASLQRQLLIPAGARVLAFEFRAWYSGKGTLSVDGVTIKPRSRCGAAAIEAPAP